ERVCNTRHVLVQTSLGDQRAAENRGTEQAQRKKQKSALNDESRHADNANEQNNGDSSQRASQRGGRRFAVPSALEYRDQAAHPDHGMTNGSHQAIRITGHGLDQQGEKRERDSHDLPFGSHAARTWRRPGGSAAVVSRRAATFHRPLNGNQSPSLSLTAP